MRTWLKVTVSAAGRENGARGPATAMEATTQRTMNVCVDTGPTEALSGRQIPACEERSVFPCPMALELHIVKCCFIHPNITLIIAAIWAVLCHGALTFSLADAAEPSGHVPRARNVRGMWC